LGSFLSFSAMQHQGFSAKLHRHSRPKPDLRELRS
jgi:hypothetical protein